jgi:hypothetical protein
MAMVEAGFKSEISNIQREMARARRQIHDDVGGAIDGVSTLTDWRTIVRGYPWVSLAIAAAVGYVIVPRRKAASVAAPVETRRERDDRIDRIAPFAQPAQRRSSVGKWALLSSTFAVISPIALRLAQSYALRYLERWLLGHALPTGPEGPGRSRGESGARPFSAPASPEGSRDIPRHG